MQKISQNSNEFTQTGATNAAGVG